MTTFYKKILRETQSRQDLCLLYVLAYFVGAREMFALKKSNRIHTDSVFFIKYAKLDSFFSKDAKYDNMDILFLFDTEVKKIHFMR